MSAGTSEETMNRVRAETPRGNHQDGDPGWGGESLKWEAPEPITNPLSDVEVMPSDLIPDAYRGWITDISYRMQTPPDFAAVTAINVTAAVIGSGCAIKPKQRDDWTVIPNLWGACIGRPSVVLKSPSMKEPLDMLGRLQAKAKEEHSVAMQHYEFDVMLRDSDDKDFEKSLSQAAKANDKVKLEKLRNDFVSKEDQEPPICRIYKTNETSIQSMTVLQQQNPRGILTFRDELTGLLTRWDKRDGEDERGYFLEGWNGNGSYTDFKIGRGLTEADNICISVIGGIQPDKLRRYLHQSMTGGNDGLMQRFQLAVYPDEPKVWKLVDQYPDKAAKDRAYETLATLDASNYSDILEVTEYDKFPFLRFSDDAQTVFNVWLTELQGKLPQEDNPLMAEHFGKFRSLMPSLALIFHLINVADGRKVLTKEVCGQISMEAAVMAVGWCDYLEDHARRIYGYVASPEKEAAIILSDRLHKLPDPFTAKDVYDKGWHLLGDRGKVNAACEVLIDSHWLMVEHLPSSGGRPPAPQYHVNPILKKKAENT